MSFTDINTRFAITKAFYFMGTTYFVDSVNYSYSHALVNCPVIADQPNI